MISRADEKTVATQTAAWSGLTVEQIADHLGLHGGNTSLEFNEPVYPEVEAEWISDGVASRRTVIAFKSPDTKFALFVTGEDISPGGESPDRVQGRVFINLKKIGSGSMSGMSTRGVGMNYYWDTEGGRKQYEHAWNRQDMEFSVGDPILIYSAVDPNDPEQNAYRLYIRFTKESSQKDN